MPQTLELLRESDARKMKIHGQKNLFVLFFIFSIVVYLYIEMDPYRTNQYGGYRPPPHMGAYGPPQPLSSSFVPGGRPPHTQSSFNTPSPISNASPSSPATPTKEEKLNTLFVGAIVPGISDEWIVALLEVSFL